MEPQATPYIRLRISILSRAGEWFDAITNPIIHFAITLALTNYLGRVPYFQLAVALIIAILRLTMLDHIKNALNRRLKTDKDVTNLAKELNISKATLYRYKKDPSTMQLGTAEKLSKILGIPLNDAITRHVQEPLQSEISRLDLERGIADEKDRGARFTVVSAYPVTAELPEVSATLWDADYGTMHRNIRTEYLKAREDRRQLYKAGRYDSFEIINGLSYRDFYHRRGRFAGLSEKQRDAQIAALVESTSYPHVRRQIYLLSTPELVFVTHYSTGLCYVRMDDLVLEFSGPEMHGEVQSIFNGYYRDCSIKSPEQVAAFLTAPG